MVMNTSPHTCTATEPIKRAYEYLNQVRAQFLNKREVYDTFVEVMGRFKEQKSVPFFPALLPLCVGGVHANLFLGYSLERMEVIERVAELFAGHHQLLTGFNQFLPKGYRLEPSDDPSHSNDVVIITPEGRRESRKQTNLPTTPIVLGAH